MASEKILAFIENVKELTVLELNELVKALEKEFGVSAAAPVVMAVLFLPSCVSFRGVPDDLRVRPYQDIICPAFQLFTF